MLVEVASVALLVNLMGVYFFQRYTDEGRSFGARLGLAPVPQSSKDGDKSGNSSSFLNSSPHSHFTQNARQSNLKLVMLHIIADTLSSVGVIVSAVLVKGKALHVADTVVSLGIATLIVVIDEVTHVTS